MHAGSSNILPSDWQMYVGAWKEMSTLSGHSALTHDFGKIYCHITKVPPASSLLMSVIIHHSSVQQNCVMHVCKLRHVAHIRERRNA
jgi:hypothetical protein